MTDDLEMETLDEEPEPGTRVYHDEYGKGTVREHPYRPESGVYVYFDDTPETTLMRIRTWKTRLNQIQ